MALRRENVIMKARSSKAMRVLTMVGTVLLCLPIGFMLLTSVIGSISRKQFLMDYMIPAELFPIVLAGAVVLIVVAFRTRCSKKRSAWLLIIMCAALFACQGLAVLTGLASGRTAAEGLPFYMVLALMILYDITVVAEIINGILIYREQRQIKV